MAERVAVLTLRTMTREIADALQATNPDATIATYDLEGIRRDRRSAILRGRSRYEGPAADTLDEAVDREMRKIASLYPWARPFQPLVEAAVRRMVVGTYAILEPFLADCDTVVLWNGMRGARFAAANIARARGLKTVFFERGFLPNTVQIDSQGVNYGSRSARPSLETVRNVAITPERQEWLDSLAFEQRPLGNMERPVAREVTGVGEIDLPPRFLLFVAQVHDDTQIDFYSPHFRTVEAAIRYTHAELRAHNETHGDDLRLVVKEHPQDYRRARYGELRRELADALFLHNVNNDELIARSAAVVTVNSSMGLQAIAQDRPVATLGESVYGLSGVVYRAPEDGPLRDLVPKLLSCEGLDRETQRKLLVYFREDCLVDLPSYHATGAQFAVVAERIWQTIRLQRPEPGPRHPVQS